MTQVLHSGDKGCTVKEHDHHFDIRSLDSCVIDVCGPVKPGPSGLWFPKELYVHVYDEGIIVLGVHGL